MLKYIAIGVVWLLGSGIAKAQLNNQLFYPQSEDTAQTPGLFLEVQSLGFFKNNEFFDNNIIEGYTLFGYQFSPSLNYRISKEVSLQAGVFAQKDFGNPEFSSVVPLFRFHIQKKRYEFIFGTLNGRLAHNLIEPLYEFENGLIMAPENGMQFIWHGRKLKADVWIDWQQMIYPGEDKQEHFFSGITLDWEVFNRNFLSLSIPVQITAFHQGGQIDTSPLPAVTMLNTAAGIRLERIYPQGPLRFWRLEQFYTLYGDNGDTPTLGFDKGQGIYSNLLIGSRYLDVMLSYWNGSTYASPMGGILYQSVSPYKQGVEVRMQEKRSLVFLRLMKNFTFEDNIHLGLRVQPVYDLNRQKLESYQGVYIRYSGDFLLWKKK